MARVILHDFARSPYGRMVVVTVDGSSYQIPEWWLIGAERSMSFNAAVLQWHEQAKLETSVRH